MFVISERMISRKWILKKELLLFGILTVFVTWMMFYVFHMKDGILYSGFSVYGDYAPHTAMMRSFSRGNNFPTQYPHYGGQDVKYHFCSSSLWEIWSIWAFVLIWDIIW